jgi:hypothetical protein
MSCRLHAPAAMDEPQNRRVGGVQSKFGRSVEQIHLLLLAGIQPEIPDFHPLAWSLYRLCCVGSSTSLGLPVS